jgi:hypothetical protein
LESWRTPKSHFWECEWWHHISFKVGLQHTWQGSHLSFKKWTISTNVLCPLKTPQDQNFLYKYHMN